MLVVPRAVKTNYLLQGLKTVILHINISKVRSRDTEVTEFPCKKNMRIAVCYTDSVIQ